MADILIIGSLNADLVVRAPRFPAPGETIQGEDLAIIPGGKGANQAVASARLGAKVAMIGRVGKDSFFVFETWCLCGSSCPRFITNKPIFSA